MSSVSSLLRDLETTMVRGSADERTQILSRLTDLFLSTAAVMDEDQVGIFDEYWCYSPTNIMQTLSRNV